VSTEHDEEILMRRRPLLIALAAVVTLTLASPAFGAGRDFGDWESPVNSEAVEATSAELNTPYLDGCPIQSPDGTELYMASTRPGGLGGIDIWVAHRQTRHDAWGAPVNLGAPVNSELDDFCPTPTGGRTFYFVSTRAGGCGVHPTGDVYVTRLEPGGYTEPENLGCEVNTAGAEASPAPVREGRDHVLYFSSTRGDGFAPAAPVDADIWRTTMQRDGRFGPPQLVAGLNTAADDSRPSVRNDGLEIVFDSTRPGTLGGPDVYSSTRAGFGAPWSEPVNLGPTINSPASETRASLSRDGSILQFGSNRPGSELGPDGLTPSNDIYESTRLRT
jgi:WD40-like Beta Propeller Repeat